MERRKQNYLEKTVDQMSSNDDDIRLSATEENVLETLRKDLSKKRDSQLKAEIRRIQTESALADKESISRVAEERRRAEEAMAVEEKQLRRKQVGEWRDGAREQVIELAPLVTIIASSRNDVICMCLNYIAGHLH